MIRLAELDDVQGITELLEGFHRLAPHYTYNIDEVHNGAWSCIQSGDFSFVSVNNGVIQGVFLGLLTQNPIMSRSMVQEVVWYAEDQSGYSLLKAAIKAAKKHNVQCLHHTMLEPVDERAHNILTKRIGFSPLERSYLMKF